MKSVLFYPLLALLACTNLSAQAEDFYKWVDRNGVTHFSEKKPKDQPSTLVSFKGGNPPPAQSKAVEPQPSIQYLTAETPLADNQNRAHELSQRQLEVQHSNCVIAKNRLIALENAGQVRLMDRQSGEYRYLPDREKLAEIAKMRSYIKTKCLGKK